MVTSRDTPTPANSPGGLIGEAQYSEAVAEAIRALWATAALTLNNVGGTVNDITAMVTPALDTPYAAPMSFWLLPLNDNTGPMTIDINSQGAVQLLDEFGDQFIGGEIVAGKLYLLTTVAADQIRVVGVTAGVAGGDVEGGANVQTFLASAIWTKPGSGNVALIQCWGGGGSGGRGGSTDGGGGGGGGAYTQRIMPLSALPAQVTVTIGAGGAAVTADNTNGDVGGTTTFGSFLSAFGGGGGSGTGDNCGGGGGGGAVGAGATATATVGANGGLPRGNLATTSAGAAATGFFGAGGAAGVPGANGTDGGGGGGGSTATPIEGGNSTNGGGGGGAGTPSSTGGAGGSSINGGGGGGGGSGTTTAGAGGTSISGGAGGAGSTDVTAATDGSVPGGGGGGSESANSGAGGSGMCVVTVW